MECLEDNEVVDFVQGELTEQRRGRIEAHLDDCPGCLALVSELARVYEVEHRPSEVMTVAVSEEMLGSAGASTPAEIDDPSPRIEGGTRLGRYVVLHPVGSGGMGIVYAAYDPELDRKIALKVLRDVGSEHRQRLLREGQAMARLSHPNVITVHDVGTWDDRLYVAMEFVDGGTLLSWLNTKRSSKEVLEAFVAAGEGLAAAHAAGLVHRDFKPANVLVNDVGSGSALRPRVTDFGLARPGASAEQSGSTEEEPTHEGSSALTISLTRTGAMVGTPAYMAPEQYDLRPADARSDQFSFCVALFEGLYGRRPFAGGSIAELAANMTAEKIVLPPVTKGVPPRVLRALRRGLRADPAARFDSVDALLSELRKDPAARWRTTASVGLPAIGVATIAFVATAHQDAPCDDSEARLGDAWSDARRQAVRKAFEHARVPFSQNAWASTSEALDAYARAWKDGWADACEATQVRQEQSESLLDLRMACLAERRAQLDALSDVLTRADADVVTRANDAVAELYRIEDCADLEALTAAVPLPEDPKTRERVAKLQAQLARADALRATSADFDEARRIAWDVAEQARELGYAPLLARALYRASSLGEDPDRQEELLQQTLEAAIEGRDDRTAAVAAIEIAGLAAEDERRASEANRWIGLAQALAHRMGDDQSIEIRILEKRSLWAGRRGEYDEALALGREVVGRVRALHGDEHPRVAVALGNLGQVLQRAGRLQEAGEAQRKALAIDEEVRGPDHPETSLTLNNLGAVHLQLGEYAEALPYLERALEIREAAFGPDSTQLLSALQNLGEAQRGVDRHEASAESFARAREITERALGSDHPRMAGIWLDLGITAFEQGDYEAALASYENALAMREKVSGPDDPSTAVVRYNFAEALERLGRYEEALEHHRRALETLESKLGADHMYVAYPAGGVGRMLLQRGQLAEARAQLERALGIHEAKSAPPVERANVRLALAMVLGAQGHASQARELASRTAQELEGTGLQGEYLRERVTAYLGTEQ